MAKYFEVRKPEIIATSANQIVLLKFCGGVLYYIHLPFLFGGFKASLLVAKFSFLGYGKGTPFCAHRGPLQVHMMGLLSF